MPMIPGNFGRTIVGEGTFHPAERPQQHGVRANPTALLSKKTLAGVLLCGLQEGEGKRAKKHTMAEVIRIVKTARVEQVGSADASFLSQHGLYTHHGSGNVITEQSVRIIIIKVTGPEETDKQFTENIARIGEELCVRLGQETVIMERQVNGMVKSTYLVTAE